MKGEEGKENLLEIGSPQAHVRRVAVEIAGLEAVSFSTLCTCADPAKLRVSRECLYFTLKSSDLVRPRPFVSGSPWLLVLETERRVLCGPGGAGTVQNRACLLEASGLK